MPPTIKNGAFTRRHAALIMLMALVLQACAEQELPPINTGIQGNQYEYIGIRAVPYESNPAKFNPPVKGASKGASLGAGEATVGWVSACMSDPDPLFPLFCLVLTPVVTVTGALAGAGASHSAKEVTSATTALKSALQEAAPSEALAQAVVRELGMTRGRRHVRVLTGNAANLPNAELTKLGFDAVLEIEVTHLDLLVFGKIDPDAAAVMMVHGRLYDTAGPSVSVPISWTYQGERHDYFDLAKDNAGLLRKAFQQSYDNIAARIVDDLFPAPAPN